MPSPQSAEVAERAKHLEAQRQHLAKIRAALAVTRDLAQQLSAMRERAMRAFGHIASVAVAVMFWAAETGL